MPPNGRTRPIWRTRATCWNDDHAYIGITREFHELTVSGSPNRVFRLFALGLMSMFIGGLNKAIYTVEKRRQVLKEHEDILKAILAKNPAKTERLMMQHMAAVQASIASRYQNSYHEIVSWR
jgi:DNA-binding FadR family transcriptional regulator